MDGFYSILISILSFVFAIGVAVLIHEFGHFIFAKRAGVYVHEFAVGMGPKLWSTKKDETTYSLRAFPLGGFVAMAGEGIEYEEEVPKERFVTEASFLNKFLIFFMGAGFNFLLAIMLIFFVNLGRGVVTDAPIIGGVTDDYPASEAGIIAGDQIISIDGTEVSNWDQVFNLIDDQVTVVVLRDGVEKTFSFETGYSEESQAYFLGIAMKTEFNILKSFTDAFKFTIDSIKQMFKIIEGLILGSIDPKRLAGPVGIFKMAGNAGSTGFTNLVVFTAFLSINLGFVNLIPIPAFDGGRILIIAFEAITRRKLSQKTEMVLQTIGLVMILMLLVYVTYNDFTR